MRETPERLSTAALHVHRIRASGLPRLSGPAMLVLSRDDVCGYRRSGHPPERRASWLRKYISHSRTTSTAVTPPRPFHSASTAGRTRSTSTTRTPRSSATRWPPMRRPRDGGQAPYPDGHQRAGDPGLGAFQRPQGARPWPDPVRRARGLRSRPLRSSRSPVRSPSRGRPHTAGGLPAFRGCSL